MFTVFSHGPAPWSDTTRTCPSDPVQSTMSPMARSTSAKYSNAWSRTSGAS